MIPINPLNHHATHRHLLWVPDAPLSDARIDAIVVPTVHAASALDHARKLAKELRCRLLALCSGELTKLRSEGDRLIEIDVSPGDLGLPVFETSQMLAGTPFQRTTDLAAKRNLALALARMLGWRRIVYLDDDILIRGADDLRRAAGLLGQYRAVGLSVGGFPDNSVVCHAYRAVGGPQESFISGGAIAVETTREISFFPNVYNEDWFWLLDDKGLAQLAVTGVAVQQEHDPYGTPERARSEEFGDVLAEGIYWLLDEGKTVAHADERHWADFLDRRHRFIKDIVDRVADLYLPHDTKARMGQALDASLEQLTRITPELCVSYLHAWRNDRETWRTFVLDLPAELGVPAALKRLL
ncbi:hypothetical protein ACIBG8_11445 [Nonomuraea sp. NPDC050556]|uniref:hypothetical protein n=1 Tax=Nonomuraea sp. NPDC050556 TaxID=3364369 RepID=UPI0037A2D7A4